MVVSSSLVRGDNEVEGAEFSEAVAASLMRFCVEASSLRYLSRSTMKSVMPSWCITEMSSAQSQVCTLQVTCLMMGVMEFQAVNREFTIMPRHSTWR